MAEELVWITGGSGGIGRALVQGWVRRHAQIIAVGRTPLPGASHLYADLSDPASWDIVGRAFETGLRSFTGSRVVLVQAAGVLDPIGFAGEVDPDAYRANVVLNSAAFQVLGDRFLYAGRHLQEVRRQMLILGSGAAHTVYPGWSAYGAAKAAVEQWVRNVGAEQALRGGAEIVALAPGTVDTAMQTQLRETEAEDFPAREKFVALYEQGRLASPDETADRILALLDGPITTGAVLDLRDLASAPALSEHPGGPHRLDDTQLPAERSEVGRGLATTD